MKTVQDLIEDLQKLPPENPIVYDYWTPIDVQCEAEDLNIELTLEDAAEVLETMTRIVRRHGYEGLEVHEEIRAYASANNAAL